MLLAVAGVFMLLTAATAQAAPLPPARHVIQPGDTLAAIAQQYGSTVEAIVAAIENLFGIHFLDPNIYYISNMPSDIHAADVIAVGAGAFIMSLLATLYPAWRASRTEPAEALRYE